MPIYKYQCQSCEVIFEKLHLMSETVDTCVECGAKVQKLLSDQLSIKKTMGSAGRRVGAIVEKYIEDVTEEVKNEKNRLSTQEYNK